MSSKLVHVCAFLLVLSLAGITTVGRCGEPAKKSLPELSDDPFGDGKLQPAVPGNAAEKPVPPSVAKAKPASHVKLHGGEKAILRALKRKASFDFVCTPLNDVVDSLSEKYRIPIRLDVSGLKDAGMCENNPVTCKLSCDSLQSALEIMLDELQLKWTIHHDVLIITSPQKAESDEFMCTKMYNVMDLISPIPDAGMWSNPLTLPDNVVSDPISSASGVPYGPPVAYTGMPPWPTPTTYTQHRSIGRTAPFAPNQMADFQPLKDAITNLIEQKSWLDNGGAGTISEVPQGYLIICQTMGIQRQIAHFLTELHVRQRAVPVFRVELHWLWLDAAHRDRLLATSRGRLTKNVVLTVDSRRLSQIASEVPCFHSLATCMSSETNRLAMGDRRAMIINAVPVIDGSVAYSPIVSMPNVGVTAAVLPMVLPDKKTAMLSVNSLITRWTTSRSVVVGSAWQAGSHDNEKISQPPVNAAANESAKSGTVGTNDLSSRSKPPTTTPLSSVTSHGAGSASSPIDLPVMPMQEFGTTLRVPLGKPVVVGSVTFGAAGDAGLGAATENSVEVYLIATTSIVKK